MVHALVTILAYKILRRASHWMMARIAGTSTRRLTDSAAFEQAFTASQRLTQRRPPLPSLAGAESVSRVFHPSSDLL